MTIESGKIASCVISPSAAMTRCCDSAAAHCDASSQPRILGPSNIASMGRPSSVTDTTAGGACMPIMVGNRTASARWSCGMARFARLMRSMKSPLWAWSRAGAASATTAESRAAGHRGDRQAVSLRARLKHMRGCLRDRQETAAPDRGVEGAYMSGPVVALHRKAAAPCPGADTSRNPSRRQPAATPRLTAFERPAAPCDEGPSGVSFSMRAGPPERARIPARCGHLPRLEERRLGPGESGARSRCPWYSHRSL